MSLQNILVHLDHTSQSDGRFEVALALAERHRAQLSGFFPSTAPIFSQRLNAADQAEQQSVLAARARERGVSLHWLGEEDGRTTLSVAEQLILQAYYTDLAVIAKPDPAAGPRGGADLPEKLVVASGVPVLITPPPGAFKPAAERVVVAWRAGRASVRSLRDALPLLQMANHVKILSLASDTSGQAGDEHSLDRLCRHLARHGVEAQAERLVAAGIGMGDALLNRSVDESADLLVVGGFAYKQPMPIATYLVKNTTIPVFMAN